MAQPKPQRSELVVDAQSLARQAAKHDHGQGDQKDEYAKPLSLRFCAANQRCQEQSAGNPRSRDPKDGQLQVPGAGQVVRQKPGEVEAVEGTRLYAIMGKRAAHRRLQEKQDGNDCEVHAKHILARRDLPAVNGPFGHMHVSRSPAPPEVVETSENKQHQPEATEETNQTQGAPQVGGRSRSVSRQRFKWPIVRIRVHRSGSQGHRGPGRPGKIRIQGAELALFVNETRRKSRCRGLAGEVGSPFELLDKKGCLFAWCENQSLSFLVVAVLLEGALDRFANGIRLLFREVGERLTIASLRLRIARDL